MFIYSVVYQLGCAVLHCRDSTVQLHAAVIRHAVGIRVLALAWAESHRSCVGEHKFHKPSALRNRSNPHSAVHLPNTYNEHHAHMSLFGSQTCEGIKESEVGRRSVFTDPAGEISHLPLKPMLLKLTNKVWNPYFPCARVLKQRELKHISLSLP